MHVLDVLVPPHLLVTVPQGLERVVTITDWQEFALEEIGEEVLVWETVRGNSRVVVEEFEDLGEGLVGGLEDDESRVETGVGVFCELFDGEGSRVDGLSVTTVLRDPVGEDGSVSRRRTVRKRGKVLRELTNLTGSERASSGCTCKRARLRSILARGASP